MDTRTIRVPGQALRRGPGDHDVYTAVWPASGDAAGAAGGITGAAEDGAAGGIPGGAAGDIAGGAAAESHPLVAVHGLGGSHLNWVLLAPLLAGHPRIAGHIWALDLPGFGLTPPESVSGATRGAKLADHLDLLAGFIDTVSPGRPVWLMGNSMGGLLSLLLAARAPRLVAGLVLVNPAVPAPLGARLDAQVVRNFAMFALPGVGERVLRLRQSRMTPMEQVEQTMELCAADPSRLDRELMTAHAALAERRRAMPYAHRVFLESARDIVRTVTVGRASVWDAAARIGAPTLLLQGAKDRLVRPAASEVLMRHRPDWTHRRYDELGHVPMVEDPERVAGDLSAWLEHIVPAVAG